jgi:hypothetical protein
MMPITRFFFGVLRNTVMIYDASGERVHGHALRRLIVNRSGADRC